MQLGFEPATFRFLDVHPLYLPSRPCFQITSIFRRRNTVDIPHRQLPWLHFSHQYQDKICVIIFLVVQVTGSALLLWDGLNAESQFPCDDKIVRDKIKLLLLNHIWGAVAYILNIGIYFFFFLLPSVVICTGPRKSNKRSGSNINTKIHLRHVNWYLLKRHLKKYHAGFRADTQVLYRQLNWYQDQSRKVEVNIVIHRFVNQNAHL